MNFSASAFPIPKDIFLFNNWREEKGAVSGGDVPEVAPMTRTFLYWKGIFQVEESLRTVDRVLDGQ